MKTRQPLSAQIYLATASDTGVVTATLLVTDAWFYLAAQRIVLFCRIKDQESPLNLLQLIRSVCLFTHINFFDKIRD